MILKRSARKAGGLAAQPLEPFDAVSTSKLEHPETPPIHAVSCARTWNRFLPGCPDVWDSGLRSERLQSKTIVGTVRAS